MAKVPRPPGSDIPLPEKQSMDDDRPDEATRLAQEHGRMVFATAYRILGDAHDAEDVLQDVFLKLLGPSNGRRQLGSVRDWGAYLRVTASRSAIDLLRRNARRIGRTPDLADVEDFRGESVEETSSRRQMARYLRDAVAALPRRDSEVFALRYFEELSYRDIARQLEISVNQVGVSLHRSRNRLKELLGPVIKPRV